MTKSSSAAGRTRRRLGNTSTCPHVHFGCFKKTKHAKFSLHCNNSTFLFSFSYIFPISNLLVFSNIISELQISSISENGSCPPSDQCVSGSCKYLAYISETLKIWGFFLANAKQNRIQKNH